MIKFAKKEFDKARIIAKNLTPYRERNATKSKLNSLHNVKTRG
jgi:hypothetical protein